jgi:ABC-type transport system involved in cytochrome c biogenesis permease subunit
MANESRQRSRGIAVVVILVVLGIVAFVILKVFTPAHVPIDEPPESVNAPM